MTELREPAPSLDESESNADRRAYLTEVLGRQPLDVMLLPDMDRYRLSEGPKIDEEDKISFLFAAIQDLEAVGFTHEQIGSIFRNHGFAAPTSFEHGYVQPLSALIQTGQFPDAMARIEPLIIAKLEEQAKDQQ